MKKPILITLLCAGLMLVTPFSVVARENTISSNLSEQPDVERLVAQIRVVIDEILQKYGHIPMVSNLGNLIFRILDILFTITFCIFLLILLIPIILLISIIDGIGILPQNLLWLALLIASRYDSTCPPSTPLFDYLSPLRTISTLKDIDDITNLAKGCPYLQE